MEKPEESQFAQVNSLSLSSPTQNLLFSRSATLLSKQAEGVDHEDGLEHSILFLFLAFPGKAFDIFSAREMRRETKIFLGPEDKVLNY